MKRVITRMLFCFVVSATSLSAESIFDPIINESGDWKESGWFGWHFGGQDPYVLHAQHGWLYAVEWSGWLWVYDYGLREWFATHETLYPMLYEALGDCWLWYYSETANPRWYVEMSGGGLYSEYEGILMPQLMKTAFDTTFLLTSEAEGTDLGQGMDELSRLFQRIIMSPQYSSCPDIITDPAEVSIWSLPEDIFILADFGEGCSSGDNLGVFSGSMEVSIEDLSMDIYSMEEITMGLNVVMDNLKRNGIPIMDGGFGGTLSILTNEEWSWEESIDVTTTDYTFDVDFTFANLVGLGQTINGGLGLDGTMTTVVKEDGGTFEILEESTSADLILTLDQLTSSLVAELSGTLHLVVPESMEITVDADLQTSDGPIDMTLVMTPSEDMSTMDVTSDGPSIVLGYEMTILDWHYDFNQCATYPVSADILIHHNGLSYRISMSDACDGSYTIRKLKRPS